MVLAEHPGLGAALCSVLEPALGAPALSWPRQDWPQAALHCLLRTPTAPEPAVAFLEWTPEPPRNAGYHSTLAALTDQVGWCCPIVAYSAALPRVVRGVAASGEDTPYLRLPTLPDEVRSLMAALPPPSDLRRRLAQDLATQTGLEQLLLGLREALAANRLAQARARCRKLTLYAEAPAPLSWWLKQAEWRVLGLAALADAGRPPDTAAGDEADAILELLCPK